MQISDNKSLIIAEIIAFEQVVTDKTQSAEVEEDVLKLADY